MEMRKLLPVLIWAVTVFPVAAQPADNLTRVQNQSPMAMDELLWLARAVYSESDRADEQELVAWVIRNRVETGYRGDTYRQVVLEPMQFSAFNTPSERRSYILGLDQHDVVPSWMQALKVSMDVFQADPTERPFAIDTRHFYSPVSMVGRSEPTWASAGIPLSSPGLGIDPDRFRFFSGIDQGADMPGTILPVPLMSQGRPNASEKMDEQRFEQHTRAAERITRVRGTVRTRSFSGRVSRPSRPARGGGL